jgi:hypothetical protein
MSTACLFIAFDRPVAGREAEAWKSLDECLATMEGLRKEGWFERIEVVGLTPHAGSLNGFMLLIGDRARLDELRRSNAFERASMTLARLLDGYGVIPGVTLEGLRQVQQRNPDFFR